MSARLCAVAALPLALAVSACAASSVRPPASEAASTASVPPASQWVSSCKDWDEWDKAGPPFRVYGNTYYVGTCGITALLIAGDAGHVLIDGGTAAGAPVIAANIERLGFRLEDVKLLLSSHEHFDHVGGLAELQRMTGARVLASEAAAPVLSSGIASPDDPQHGMHDPFAAMRVDGTVTPGKAVKLGALSLTPIATPGHTPGALSWRWTACEGAECRSIVYADSLSPISADGYRFTDHPDTVSAFRAGLERLAAQTCDIVLAPHPSAAKMRERLVAGSMIDPAGCTDYAAGIATRLDARLAEERAQ